MACAAVVLVTSSSIHAWGGQGHRLVALLATAHLTPLAKQNVVVLLGKQTLADVASWADTITSEQQQTSTWHYLDIPPEAGGYDRDRDCPRQPTVAAGSRGDRWRDCAVDRIVYFEQKLANVKLDRADRATALKFLVHFIGDLHQPMHALGVGRGGNDVLVRVFGSANCGTGPARPPIPCNLHSVWDSRLIARRNLEDAPFLALLERIVAAKGYMTKPPGTSADWAVESWKLAKDALVSQNAHIDEAYYQKQMPVIEDRLALAGSRLAIVLNRAFTSAPID